ncbi:MAG TPA: hypothetical protein VM753_09425, partial [Anaeromyxobacter sp.]|nr:hypothetical protein [Anaeromyxobacter sp.]
AASLDPNADPAAAQQYAGFDPSVDPAAQPYAGFDPNVDPATQPYAGFDPSVDPAAAQPDAGFDLGVDPAAQPGAFEAAFETAAVDATGAFDLAGLGSEGTAAFDLTGAAPDATATLDLSGASGATADGLDLEPTNAFELGDPAATAATPEEGLSWEPVFDAAVEDARTAAPDAWLPADPAVDPGALTGIGEALDAAADPGAAPADQSFEPTESFSLGDGSAEPTAAATAPLDADGGLLPPPGWEAEVPAAGAPPDAPRGEYDAEPTTAFTLGDAGADAGLESLLPFDPATDAAIAAGETPEGFETPLGEYDDTAGFTGAAPLGAGPADVPAEGGFHAAGAVTEDPGAWHAEQDVDRGFALESAGSFDAGEAPGWATGAAALPWDSTAGEPAAAPVHAEELPTIDGEEILEEIAADDAAFAAPALDFEPQAPAPAPVAIVPPAPSAPPVQPAPRTAVAPAPPIASPSPRAKAPATPAAPPRPAARPAPAAPVPSVNVAPAAPPPRAAPPPASPARPALAPTPPSPAKAAPPPVAAPARAAPPAPPPAVEARLAGAHRVEVHTIEGQVKRGVLEDADLAAPSLALSPQPGAAGEALPTEKVKAIFFMLGPGEATPAPDGKRVRVTFKDGRQVAGFSPDYSEDRPGFFMIPADTRTNTGRIWVYRAAVKQVTVS